MNCRTHPAGPRGRLLARTWPATLALLLLEAPSMNGVWLPPLFTLLVSVPDPSPPPVPARAYEVPPAAVAPAASAGLPSGMDIDETPPPPGSYLQRRDALTARLLPGVLLLVSGAAAGSAGYWMVRSHANARIVDAGWGTIGGGVGLVGAGAIVLWQAVKGADAQVVGRPSALGLTPVVGGNGGGLALGGTF